MSLTYVVTGASRGLGLEFVKQISAQGHIVFALARNPDNSERLQSLVDNKKVFAVKLDATSEQSIKVK
jgi:NAD(P)-dependent dehydrogenase (short-subunit alcohol dehydrogenase family)